MFLCKNCKSVDKFELMFSPDYHGDKQFSQRYNDKNEIEITDEKTATSIMRLIDKLEEHDDVQNVYSNVDIPDEVMEKIEGTY